MNINYFVKSVIIGPIGVEFFSKAIQFRNQIIHNLASKILMTILQHATLYGNLLRRIQIGNKGENHFNKLKITNHKNYLNKVRQKRRFRWQKREIAVYYKYPIVESYSMYYNRL
ncbi:Hypothetical_protein [Hexamita inflata]|uniref:Hypothetical_protein n=1 Tax=Hexamita inflata TaxID=28002 RepID=A0AA86UQP3_9EUKA|nr:Hypothetical protein HINF_LOCUS48602 [Hexamita inflata]